MDLLFGVSRICTLFLWGCIFFPPQKGWNIAHGYYVDENPQTSNQFHSGAFLNTDLKDPTQVTGDRSFASPQREPVHFDYTSLGENMVQHQPDAGQEQDDYSAVPSAPAVQKYESDQHPFGVLLKQYTPMKNVEGISFPTIKDFQRFIETMKSSYLIPGRDSRGYFQTARETMKNELISDAQRIKGESSTSNSVQDGSAHDDHSENVVWNEPEGNDHKQISESLSFFNPIDSTESVTSPSGYDDHDSGASSAFYPQHDLGATEQVSSDYGSLANYGISGENPDIFSSPADDQNEVQSTSHNLPEQKLPGHLLGRSLSFSNDVTASPVTDIPSQDLSFYSSKKLILNPLSSEKTMQQPTYLSPSGDSLTRYQKSRDFQTEEQPRMTEAPQKPFDSYSKSILVRAPRKQFYLPGVSKHKERPDKSAAIYKPTIGKESNDMNSAPIIHLPESSGSNFDLSPQRSSSHMGVEASDSQDQVFSKKLPVRSHLFSVEPCSSQQPSSHDGYLPNQRVRVSRLSIGAQAQHEKSGLSRQNRVSAIQEPKLMNDYAPIQRSRGLDSTQRGISSQIDDVQTSYPTNSPPNSKLEVFSRLFGNEVISENFEVRNTSSGRFPSGDTHKKKRDPQGISLNDESVGDTTTDPLHIFTQPTNVQKRLVNVNRKLSTTASRPSKTLSTSKVSASTPVGVFWRKSGNTKRLSPQRGSKASPKPINTYVKQSRNSYVRSKVFLSKSRYSPYQHAEEKTIKDQWKSDPAQEKAPLFDGGGEKWWKNQLFQ